MFLTSNTEDVQLRPPRDDQSRGGANACRDGYFGSFKRLDSFLCTYLGAHERDCAPVEVLYKIAPGAGVGEVSGRCRAPGRRCRGRCRGGVGAPGSYSSTVELYAKPSIPDFLLAFGRLKLMSVAASVQRWTQIVTSAKNRA